MLVKILNISYINDNDETFIIQTSFDDSELLYSIEKNGILNPLKIYKINDDHNLIISGYRRFECIKKLKLNNIPCICYDSLSLTKKEAFKIALIDNHHRKYTELEKALLIKKLKEFFCSQESFFYYVITNILDINIKDLSFYESLLNQSASLLELIHNDKLKKYHAEWLLSLNKEEQYFYATLLSNLSLTKTQFYEFISLINDICRIWEIPYPKALFNLNYIKNTISSADKNKKISSALLQILKKYAYPLLTILEHNFKIKKEKLINSGINIIPAKNFEGNSIKIIFDAHSLEDFKNKLLFLYNKLNENQFNEFFDYAKKTFII